VWTVNPIPQTQQTGCCIVGGGPAGMVLGYLLARAGVEVIVFEKHADFFRDFRGDTIHPSTLELMYELGILEDFLRLPHQEIRQVSALIEDFPVTIGDLSHLPTHCKFIALMPQWDFLNFIAEKGKVYPQFHVWMNAEVVGLLEQNGRIAGVRVNTQDGLVEVKADLVVGADGRHSSVRREAKLEVLSVGAPIDVLWMRLPKKDGAPPKMTLGRVRGGRLLVTLDRGDYWQCAFVIRKGEFEVIQQKGLQAFREEIATVAPFLSESAAELKDWNDVKLLTVMVDRLRKWWRPGLLCIGDSAHAMSPIGGVGINLAIQDAVAAANILWQPLLNRAWIDSRLDDVQRRREFPTKVTQRIQVFAHERVVQPTLESKAPIKRLPWPLKLLQRFPALQRIPARMVALGVRPEHVHTPEVRGQRK
jgi:2-polyprenyl-6-methoxyphenol hydroxylase-like FAD-dependent oxidoreductase